MPDHRPGRRSPLTGCFTWSRASRGGPAWRGAASRRCRRTRPSAKPKSSFSRCPTTGSRAFPPPSRRPCRVARWWSVSIPPRPAPARPHGPPGQRDLRDASRHPPVFSDEADPETRRDFFGGVRARQHIVCALVQGPRGYPRGEALAREMFAPVMRAHRVTVEQMAILEPALSETTSQTCHHGDPRGHGRSGPPRRASRGGARLPARAHPYPAGHLLRGDRRPKLRRRGHGDDRARDQIIRPDWKRVFEPEIIRECTGSDPSPPTGVR